jgi:hypothetical protein
MSYQIEFFNQQVKTLIEAWPTGIAASFVRITEQMIVTGPNTELKIARKKLKEISNA